MAIEALTEKDLNLIVITPAKEVLKTKAQFVVAPAFDGEIGVLPGHAEMLALLGNGELRVNGTDGKVRHIAIRGGFLQVSHNNVTVLTPESVSAEDIHPEALAAELEKLNAKPAVKPEEREAYEVQKAWIKLKEKVASKK